MASLALFEGFLGSRVHFISPFPDEVTKQLFPSTVTVLFLSEGEKPLPVMVRYWPPIFPVEGETPVIEGKAVYSKYSLGFNDDLLRKILRSA